MTTDPTDPTDPDAAPTAAPEQTQPSVPPSAGPPTRPAWLLPTATGVIGLVLGAALMGAVLSARSSAARSALLTDAVEACDIAYTPGITLGDEGTSITFDMRGEDETSGADYVEIACLFAELDIPSAVTSHIDQTTSMDGRQTETWDNLTVSWSYHPDRGLDGVLTVGDA